MLPSSVRRVVASAASSTSQTGLVSSLASATIKTTPLFVRNHPRRYSSSKPSKSDNGSNEISADQSVPATTTPKSGSEKRKRKSNKDASDRAASMKKLPSVPSTHHMSQEGRTPENSNCVSSMIANRAQLLVYQVSSHYIGLSLLLKPCPEPCPMSTLPPSSLHEPETTRWPIPIRLFPVLSSSWRALWLR